MAVEMFKLQTPFLSRTEGCKVLLYNRDRSVYYEVEGRSAEKLVDGLDMRPQGDRIYVLGTVVDDELHVDRDTVTRKEMDW